MRGQRLRAEEARLYGTFYGGWASVITAVSDAKKLRIVDSRWTTLSLLVGLVELNTLFFNPGFALYYSISWSLFTLI